MFFWLFSFFMASLSSFPHKSIRGTLQQTLLCSEHRQDTQTANLSMFDVTSLDTLNPPVRDPSKRLSLLLVLPNEFVIVLMPSSSLALHLTANGIFGVLDE
jgi:hypothetical protein